MVTRKMKSKPRANLPSTNQQIYELVNIFELTTCKLDEVVNPWRSEEKLKNFNEVLKFIVHINNFSDYVDISLKESSY
jgi:hypothetical protein